MASRCLPLQVVLLGMDILSALVTRLQDRFKAQIGTGELRAGGGAPPRSTVQPRLHSASRYPTAVSQAARTASAILPLLGLQHRPSSRPGVTAEPLPWLQGTCR